MVTVSYPPAPDGLLKASRERWDAFWASDLARKVDQRADLPRLNRWIEQSDQYDRVRAEVGKQWTVAGSTGQLRTNPLLGYLSQLDAQLARAESEFGMTPLARQRLTVDLRPAKPEPEEAPPDGLDDLAKRREAKAASA